MKEKSCSLVLSGLFCFAIGAAMTPTNAWAATALLTPAPIPTCEGSDCTLPRPPLRPGPISFQPAGSVVWETQPVNWTAGIAMQPFSVSALNTSGEPMSFPAGTTCSVSIASGPAGATISGTYQNVPASGTELTFSDVVLDTAGAYSLVVSCFDLTPTLGSAAFGIGANTPANISILTQPASTAINGQTQLSASVFVTDAFGNAVSGSTWGNVSALLAGPGVTAGNFNALLTASGNSELQATPENGVADFSNMVITTTEPGTYNLVFYVNGVSVTSQNIVVSNPAGAIAYPPASIPGYWSAVCANSGLYFDFDGVDMWVYANELTSQNTIVVNLLYVCTGTPVSGAIDYSCGIDLTESGSKYTMTFLPSNWTGYSSCSFTN